MAAPRIFVVAAEASGDLLGAELIAAIRARAPAAVFAGTGGAAMAAVGVESAIEIKDLAILGFVDGIKAYKRVVALADETLAAAQAFNPDAVVLIDSWGFTLRVAQRLRAAGLKARLIKYIGPQVWATRAGRARTLAASVDHLICIHDFEVPFYQPFGLKTTVCGHPAFGRFAPGSSEAFRCRMKLTAGERVALVLPGSRRSELRRVGPALLQAAKRLAANRPDLRPIVLAAANVEAEAKALADAAGIACALERDGKEDAFAAAAVTLACSGTVTTEAALQQTPVIVGYKLGWITWALARVFLYKSRFATLMNVAVDQEVCPEFIQTRLTAANLAAAAGRLLDSAEARNAQIAAQNAALDAMGRSGPAAADIAAAAVLSELSAR
jgi:lipid-A-disaccharide synthase